MKGIRSLTHTVLDEVHLFLKESPRTISSEGREEGRGEAEVKGYELLNRDGSALSSRRARRMDRTSKK